MPLEELIKLVAPRNYDIVGAMRAIDKLTLAELDAVLAVADPAALHEVMMLTLLRYPYTAREGLSHYMHFLACCRAECAKRGRDVCELFQGLPATD